MARLFRSSSPLSPSAVACSVLLAASPAFADVPNGSCATASPVSGSGQFSVPVGQSNATNTTVSDCGDGTNSCWYSFTPPSDGVLAISGLPSNFGDIALVAIKDDCGQEGFLNCSISKGNFAASVSLAVDGGQTYRIVFARLGSPAGKGDVINTSALFLPSTCSQAPEAATCCVSGPWVGCSTPECCTLICAADPFCCSEGWDLTCTQAVRTTCAICLAPDCDQDGAIDSIEYGPNPTLTLLPQVTVNTLGTPAAFCPEGKPNSKSTLIFTGLSGIEEARTLAVPYAGNLAFGGLVARGATVFAYGDDGSGSLELLGVGARVDRTPTGSRLTFSGLNLDASVLNVGGFGFGSTAPVMTLRSCTAYTSEVLVEAGLLNVGDDYAYQSSTLSAAEVFVGPLGALRVRDGSTVEASDSMIFEGLLQVDAGGTFSSIDPQIDGTLPSSWLRGAGTLVGQVDWRGCIKPSGPLTIQGQLTLLPYDGAEQSRYLWKLRDVAQPSLTVTGPAILAGTLQIDASSATIGDSAMVIRAGSFIGDFKSIQTTGLPPQFALIVSRVQGGLYEEFRADVLPITQVLGYGDSTSYPLALEPKDAVSADFDGDGTEDLAVSLSGGETEQGAVVVFRGTGAGLQQVLQISVGTDPRGIDAGDINLDGKIDLVVALAGDDGIRELRNTSGANITFDPLAVVPVGDKPVDVSLGNFIVDAASVQGGSKLDAFVAVELDEEFTFVKNSGGTLGDGGTSSVPSPGGLPTSTGGGDTDNDRVDDGVGGSTGGGTIIPGGSSGAAFTPIFIPTPHPVTSIAVTDVTGDGVVDVVATLDATSPRPTPPGTPEVFDTVGVINAVSAAQGAVYALNLYDFGREGRSVSKGDFDNDGDQDLAFAARSPAGGPAELRIVRNDMGPGGALLTQLAPPAIDGEPQVVETISIDGVGDDVVVLGPTNLASNSQVLLQRFAEPTIFGDLTGDGVINAYDLKVLLSQWGGPGSADLNLDGHVAGADLTIFLTLWTKAPPN